ncbi:hypothetical protein EDF35_1934 [Rathayibacter sp. PhB151]|uniref:hypothetical protein n=1 Tax=Rathayibacter sp. PhB151 TaxID=2485189 RepID=UPI001063A705|nr:hypothetical protein [Rathayibacter sp. PhB151]TDX78720.1 hypothetical protein EDF35_1934 [Rathayibacter sp. PhB151]
MSWDDEFWYPHTVNVRDVSASGGRGSNYGASRTIAAEVRDEQRLVRTADGSEAVSSTKVTVPLDSDVAPGALVTVWAGRSSEREAEVLAVAREENAEPLDSFLLLSLA